MDNIKASTYLIQLYSYYFRKCGSINEDYREAVTLAVAALMKDNDK